MKLYLVTADDDNGENRDLFVRAIAPEQAVKLWREYWWKDDDDDLDKPTHCFEVPHAEFGDSTEVPHAISWDDIPDCEGVTA